MDPISTAGIIESSFGLALQLGNVAKTLSDIAAKYKSAKLTVKSLAQNLNILQLTWSQIGQWLEAFAEDENTCDNDLIERVRGFLETGTVVMAALEKDLLAFDIENLNFAQRSKLIWKENTLQGHQIRIRDQTLSMSLFLQAVKLPTPKARAKLLRSSENQFRRSDESAFSTNSIIPSQLSSYAGPRDSWATSSQGSLDYRPLSFEDKLFMSRVYMRNTKNVMIKRIFRIRAQADNKTREPLLPLTNWEPIRNDLEADSLLSSSQQVSFEGNENIRPYNDHQNRDTSHQNFDTPFTTTDLSPAALIQACEHGDSIQVKRLLVSGLDVHARFTEFMYSGYTAIHVAALHGHMNVVDALLDHSANIDEEELKENRRPLHFAAGSRQISMVEFLIRRGAQVDAKARDSVQPMHVASWSGSVEILDALIEAGAAVNCTDRVGYQPLHWAMFAPNQPELIRSLTNKKADIDAKVSDGSRAVHLACKISPHNLSTLLTLGAKTDFDDGTESALITAVNSNCKIAVELLLKHGVDPNRETSDGGTALHALATLGSRNPGESSNDREICQMLLDSGASPHIKDGMGNQVLHCLASHSSTSTANLVAVEELAKLVLERGGDKDATNNQGHGPLYIAICCGNRQLTRLLLLSGACVLRQTDVLRVGVQAETVLNSQKPKYNVNFWVRSRGHVRWVKRATYLDLKLSWDEDGCFFEPKSMGFMVNLDQYSYSNTSAFATHRNNSI